jgi:DNA-binding NtrC family response regulator/tetratricopeptide (TPR) repeat protein
MPALVAAVNEPILPPSPDVSTMPPDARVRAEEAMADGRHRDAEGLFLAWLDETPADGRSAQDRAQVHFRLAILFARANRPDESGTQVEHGEALAAGHDDPTNSALAAIAQAWLAIQSDREPAALAPAERALALAGSHGLEDIAADARQCLGIAAAVAGQPEVALDHLFDAFTYHHGRGRRAKMLDLLSNLGAVSLLSGHSETARGYLRRAAAIGVELGAGSRLAVVLMNLGIVNMGMGHWDEAEANLKESIRLHHAAGNWRLAIEPTVSLGRLMVMRGRFSEAAAHLTAAEGPASKAQLDRHLAWIDAVAGELAMAEGAFDAARQRFDALVDWADRAHARTVGGALRRRAEASLALSELDLAEADLAGALRELRVAGDRVEEGIARRLSFELALRRGDQERAANEIHRAVDLLRATGQQAELAHSLLYLADFRITALGSESGADGPIGGAIGVGHAIVEDAFLELGEAERIYSLLGVAPGLARCHLQRARLQIRTGMVDRALASLDRARSVLEAQGLPADRQRLRQVQTELAGEMTRAARADSRFAGLARALLPAGDGGGLDPRLALFTQVARAMAADRMFLVRSSDRSDDIVAVHRVSRRRAAELWRWLKAHHFPPEQERQPLLFARSLYELPERLFPLTGSIAFVPARPPGADFELLLLLERRAEHPAGVISPEQIEFLRASVEALAELHKSAGAKLETEGPARPRRGAMSRSARIGRRVPSSGVEGLVAASPGMRQVFDQVEQLAESDVPVLILGETGVGKERIARAIHALGSRRAKVFVPFMAAGLGHELIESQLFGHVRGAFTSADRDRQGLLKAADGGTFFMDEVGEIPLGVQVSFLRFLETGEFRRIGESDLSRADIRVLSATHRDLRADVRDGRFRQDLFYRIAPVVLEVPPLRERLEDIPLLVEHFLGIYAQAAGKPNLRLATEVEEAFMSYPWPGNVRELENEVRRLVALAGGHREVGLDLLSAELAGSSGRRGDSSGLPLDEERSRLERRRIIQALTDADWNQSRAARALGLKRTTLIARMKRHGILR